MIAVWYTLIYHLYINLCTIFCTFSSSVSYFSFYLVSSVIYDASLLLYFVQLISEIIQIYFLGFFS